MKLASQLLMFLLLISLLGCVGGEEADVDSASEELDETSEELDAAPEELNAAANQPPNLLKKDVSFFSTIFNTANSSTSGCTLAALSDGLKASNACYNEFDDHGEITNTVRWATSKSIRTVSVSPNLSLFRCNANQDDRKDVLIKVWSKNKKGVQTLQGYGLWRAEPMTANRQDYRVQLSKAVQTKELIINTTLGCYTRQPFEQSFPFGRLGINEIEVFRIPVL